MAPSSSPAASPARRRAERDAACGGSAWSGRRSDWRWRRACTGRQPPGRPCPNQASLGVEGHCRRNASRTLRNIWPIDRRVRSTRWSTQRAAVVAAAGRRAGAGGGRRSPGRPRAVGAGGRPARGRARCRASPRSSATCSRRPFDAADRQRQRRPLHAGAAGGGAGRSGARPATAVRRSATPPAAAGPCCSRPPVTWPRRGDEPARGRAPALGAWTSTRWRSPPPRRRWRCGRARRRRPGTSWWRTRSSTPCAVAAARRRGRQPAVPQPARRGHRPLGRRRRRACAPASVPRSGRTPTPPACSSSWPATSPRPAAPVALLQPQSVLGARDAAGVRDAVGGAGHAGGRAGSRPTPGSTPRSTSACRSSRSGRRSRRRQLERAPRPRPRRARRRPGRDAAPWADEATTTAAFRSEYYGMVDHVHEQRRPARPGRRSSPPGWSTSGRCAWGERPARIGRRSWERPVLDVGALEGRAADWVAAHRRPEAAWWPRRPRSSRSSSTRRGTWIPGVPLVVVLAPPDAAVAAGRRAGVARDHAPGLLHRAAGTALHPAGAQGDGGAAARGAAADRRRRVAPRDRRASAPATSTRFARRHGRRPTAAGAEVAASGGSSGRERSGVRRGAHR